MVTLARISYLFTKRFEDSIILTYITQPPSLIQAGAAYMLTQGFNLDSSVTV